VPEGNEIHRWAERHAAAFAGRTVRVDGPQGRFTDSGVIDGRKLKRVLAVGKHLGYDFGGDRILHVHLGLRGDFTEGAGPLRPVKGALRLRMWNAAAVRRAAVPGESKRHAWYSEDDGTGHVEPEQVASIELRGPTDCSVFSQAKWAALEARLGPDPLNGDPPDKAIERIRKSKKHIGELLMDQKVIAGLGNIFRAELLYRARLSPFAPGREVPEPVLRALYAEAVVLMKRAIRDRRIVTTEREHRPTRSRRAPREETHYVYRRNAQPCFLCGTVIQKREVAGRNLFWCPECQQGNPA
jgi:endonuclease-8